MLKIKSIFKSACERIFIGKPPKNLSDQELLARVCLWVHTIEKRSTAESRICFYDVIKTKQLYHEACKRNCLSVNEKAWCEQVLFARSVLLPYQQNYSNDTILDVNLIYSRRSIRTWSDTPITDDEYYSLVNAARWAPSSCHRQPWHFILTRDRSKIKAIAQLRGQAFVANAPSCLVVLMHMPSYKQEELNYTLYLDAGAAIENLLLAAQARNIGACWVNFGSMEVSSKNRKTVMEMFSIPAVYEIVALIPVGYPKTVPIAPARKEVYSMAHLEVFEQ